MRISSGRRKGKLTKIGHTIGIGKQKYKKDEDNYLIRSG
jgi:hypothetical protein